MDFVCISDLKGGRLVCSWSPLFDPIANMTRPLETSLKALEAAVNNLKSERAAKALKTGTNLLKLVVSELHPRPGDAF